LTIIVALDGVLRDQYGDQIYTGVKLFHSLSEHYRVMLATDESAAEAERWCLLQGITNYAVMIDNSVSWPDKPLREHQIDMARQHGQRLELIIDGDPDVAVYATKIGIPVLLFATPKPAKPTFGIRRWDEVTSEIQKQREMAAGVTSKVEKYE
jgi:hypothetical protein